MKRRKRKLTPNGAWKYDVDLSIIPIVLFCAALFVPAFVGCECDRKMRRQSPPCVPQPPLLHIDPSTGQLGVGPVSPAGRPVVTIHTGGC